MIQNTKNKSSNSNDLMIYWQRPRLKGDIDIIFAGVNFNLFYEALASIKANVALDLCCGQGTLLYNLRKNTEGICCALDLSSYILRNTKMKFITSII